MGRTVRFFKTLWCLCVGRLVFFVVRWSPFLVCYVCYVCYVCFGVFKRFWSPPCFFKGFWSAPMFSVSPSQPHVFLNSLFTLLFNTSYYNLLQILKRHMMLDISINSHATINFIIIRGSTANIT